LSRLICNNSKACASWFAIFRWWSWIV
jgi:hypothetical protein